MIKKLLINYWLVLIALGIIAFVAGTLNSYVLPDCYWIGRISLWCFILMGAWTIIRLVFTLLNRKK